MEKIRVHLYISGRVQGVFFRQNTKYQAQNNGVTGWVRNLPDGRVEAVFEGEENSVKALVDFCQRGPSSARVDNIQIFDEPFKNEFADFRMR